METSGTAADRFGVAKDDVLIGIFNDLKATPTDFIEKWATSNIPFDVLFLASDHSALLDGFAGENVRKEDLRVEGGGFHAHKRIIPEPWLMDP